MFDTLWKRVLWMASLLTISIVLHVGLVWVAAVLMNLTWVEVAVGMMIVVAILDHANRSFTELRSSLK